MATAVKQPDGTWAAPPPVVPTIVTARCLDEQDWPFVQQALRFYAARVPDEKLANKAMDIEKRLNQ